MKVLVVEDDSYKANALFDFIKLEYPLASIVIRESLSSGMFELLEFPEIDLILLDMSMPSFDMSDKDPRGGLPESFAGEDFLSQMELMEIDVPVIVVTQFETFERDDDVIPLDSLTGRLRDGYPNIFLGSVYFKSTSEEWKKKLRKIIRREIR